MSTAYPTLIIGGIEIPIRMMQDGFSQEYEEIAAIDSDRMMDGSLLVQWTWPSSARNYLLRTTISGAGRWPVPLDGLHRGAKVEIECAEHRRIGAAGRVITLPAGRRAGGIYDPLGYALVGETIVATPIESVVAHVATLTAVSGAQHYHVRYFPKFTGVLTHKSGGETLQVRRRWTLVVEEG